MIPILIIRALSPIDLEPPRELPPRASRSGRARSFGSGRAPRLGLTGLPGTRPNLGSSRSGRAPAGIGQSGISRLGPSRLREPCRAGSFGSGRARGFGRFRSGIGEISRSGRDPGFGRLEELLGNLGRIPGSSSFGPYRKKGSPPPLCPLEEGTLSRSGSA